jgi:hypothetical protein
MKLEFRGIAILTALIFFALAFFWMFAPNLLLADWGLEFSTSIDVICRRMAALFVSLAVIFFSARNAEPSVVRSALIKGAVVLFALLAALGLFELKRGNVTYAILSGVFIEIMLLLAFIVVGYSQSALPNSSVFKEKKRE